MTARPGWRPATFRQIEVIDLDELRSRLEEYELTSPFAPRTIDSYRQAWATYIRFCSRAGLDPHTDDGAVAYVVHCYERRILAAGGDTVHEPYAPTVLDQWAAAAAYQCAQAGQQNPLTAGPDPGQIARILQGYRRSALALRGRPVKAEPLTPELMRRILTQRWLCTPDQARRAAAVALHLATGAAAQDLAAVPFHDVGRAGSALTLATHAISANCTCEGPVDPLCLSCLLVRLAEAGPFRQQLFDVASDSTDAPREAALVNTLIADLRGAGIATRRVPDHGHVPGAGLSRAAEFALLHRCQGSTGWVRDRALLVLSWHLALRSADVRDHLPRASVRRTTSGYLVDLRGWKHHPAASYLYAVRATTDPLLCPVAALDAWLLIRDHETDPTRDTDPLFCRADAAGVLARDRTLSYDMQWLGLRALVRAAGIEERITPHSARVGFAEVVCQQGATLRDLADFMRHAKVSTTLPYAVSRDAKKARAARSMLQRDTP